MPDATERFKVTLPGVVHRFEAGHRLRLVIAATDDSYSTTTTVVPVTIPTGKDAGQVLDLPVVSGS